MKLGAIMKYVLIVIVLIAAGFFAYVLLVPSKSQNESNDLIVYEDKPKTFQKVIAEDDKRLRAPIKPQAAQTETTTGETEVNEPQFVELTIEEEYQAQKLFENALAQRKMGRLPIMNYKPMIDLCRQIIDQFPGSEYAAKARRMLADIPEEYRKRYGVTDEEAGLQ